MALVAAAALTAAAAMLLMRRKAPSGSVYVDSDRAASIFGVLGGAFAIILAIVVLLAFENYSSAKTQSADEASAVKDMFEAAALLPTTARADLQNDLVCYARAVVEQEWPVLRHGSGHPSVERWIARIERTADTVQPHGTREATGFQAFFASRSERDRARQERLSEAARTLPAILWIMLMGAGAAAVTYLLFWADPRERWWAQAVGASLIAGLITMAILAVLFLSSPFSGHQGSIEPAQMSSALTLMEAEASDLGDGALPCDARGAPLPS